MIQKIEKGPKVALCRTCHGTGTVKLKAGDGSEQTAICPVCEGSGRVTVSAKMEYDIRPYKQKK